MGAGGAGWFLFSLSFFFFFLSFCVHGPGDGRMTVTTDKLVRCVVGDVL